MTGVSGVAVTYLNYESRTFKLVIDEVRVLNSPIEFQKPEGGKKTTFSIGLAGPDAANTMTICESLQSVENHPNLADYFKDCEKCETTTPIWGSDGTALRVEIVPDKVYIIDGAYADIQKGAMLKVACTVTAWLRKTDNKVESGIKFRADSVKILQKKEATEIDWNACM
ncbi:MAG: hypothetical protein ACR2IJ_07260 [Fluviibacter sp.]